MRLLDFTIQLGGVDSHEIFSLLVNVEEKYWISVPLCNSSQEFNKRRPSYYNRSTQNASGDFVWINPSTGSFLLADGRSTQSAVWEPSPGARRKCGAGGKSPGMESVLETVIAVLSIIPYQKLHTYCTAVCYFFSKSQSLYERRLVYKSKTQYRASINMSRFSSGPI